MPNFDGGHYFYTGLVPIPRQPAPRPGDGSMTAPSDIVREALAVLPNYSQAAGVARTSPFARCPRTHFARLALLEDTAFNGRDPIDAIKGMVTGVDLLVHQPVDHLSTPWLLFEADFDAADGSAESRDSWACELWDTMSAELRSVFHHCHSFDKVADGAAFAAYLGRAQIETYMSFNDYGLETVPLKSLSMKRVAALILGVLALFLVAAWLLQRELALNLGWPLWIVVGLVGLAAGLWAAYRLIMRVGARPFPTAPDSDLKSVLKGLYLQRHLTRFAIDHQRDTPEALHAAFGAFLAGHAPADVERPTQTPGVLTS